MNFSFDRYWGWGGEDDEIYRRLKLHEIEINYLDSAIGRFKVQFHIQRHCQLCNGNIHA